MSKIVEIVEIILYFIIGLVFMYIITCPKKSKQKQSNLKKTINTGIPGQQFIVSDSNGNLSIFDPSNTALNSNLTVAGDLIGKTVSSENNNGYAFLGNNSAGKAGYVNFNKSDGTSKGWVGSGLDGDGNTKDYIGLNADNASGFAINTGKKLCIGSTCITENDLKSRILKPTQESDRKVPGADTPFSGNSNNIGTAITSGYTEIGSREGPYGDWGGWTMCPVGQYVCGIDTKIEPPQGTNADDTTMNAVRLRCCKF